MALARHFPDTPHAYIDNKKDPKKFRAVPSVWKNMATGLFFVFFYDDRGVLLVD